MRCSKCGTDNAAGSRFCNQCATPLGQPCPKCAHENISEAKFCAQCAAPLDGASETVGASRHRFGRGGRGCECRQGPNIAARVQAVAAPGTVLITDAVHRLVSGLFVVENRGAQALKGIEGSTQLYRVIQPSGVRGRLQAVAASRGLTPFVGREDELRSLMNRWERVLDGEGQVALITGEAGIGKSRLVQRFHEQIKDTPHTWVEAAAAPFYQNTPFYPVVAMLHELLAWGGDHRRSQGQRE